MKAFILAGGKGTRLRPLTVYTPKPIVPVANRPFLLYQIDVLRNAGIDDITLSLSYQPDKIEHIMGSGSEYGVSLHYVTEPSPLGTAGAIKFAAGEGRESIVVLNGDILTTLDLARMIASHNDSNAVATLALATVDDPSRYGLVETDKDCRVLRFIEKPKSDELANLKVKTINAGVYFLEPEVLDLMEPGKNLSFEYDVFPALLEKQMPVYGYGMTGEYWLDIGQPSNYLKANQDLIGDKIAGFPVTRGKDYEAATHSEIDKNSLIGEGCVIKPGARIVNSVIGRGVHIEEKAVITNSVIWQHSRISSFAEVTDAIIGRTCHIGRNCIVSSGTVLGDKSQLTDYTRV
jgi:mannose-1-phosphate guanylyltransferase